MTMPKKRNSKLGVALLKGETLIKEVSKHQVGAVIVIIVGLIIIASIMLAALGLYTVVNSAQPESESSYGALILYGGFILSIAVGVATFINVYLYQLNRLIVTTEKVAQITYRTIFDRKVVQLSIERVQDVTVSQVGIFPRIFHYGTVYIETAGDQEECIFTFAPDPYELSREIMNIHEAAVLNKNNHTV